MIGRRPPNVPPYRRIIPNLEQFLWPVGFIVPWWWPPPGEDLIWNSVGTLTVPRGFLGAFRFGQKIYTCGGMTPSPYTFFDTVEEFDVQTYQSVLLPNLHVPKAVEQPVVAGSSAFYIVDSVIFGKACYEIDSPAGPWNKKADMPQGQNCQTAAAGPDGKIYVIGGIKPSAGATYLNIVQCFNPNNGTWSQVQPLNSPRFSAAAAAAGGKIYIFGGMDDQANILTSVEEYDPATNKWTVLNEPMPTPRYNLAAVTGSNGRIYVVGGMYQCSAVDAVEEFDPATKLWQVMTPMPTARYGVAAAATTDGRIFVLGGWKKVASTVSATGVIEQGVLPIV